MHCFQNGCLPLWPSDVLLGLQGGNRKGKKKGALKCRVRLVNEYNDCIPFFFLLGGSTTPRSTPPSLSTPFALFLHPMYYSYNLLTLPKYRSVKLFLCVDSQGAWSLVSCLKPIRKCGYDWGCPWGLFLDGFLYYTNILDWLSQPNS